MKILLTILLLLLSATEALAQHIDFGIDAGKAYSIVDGRFVPSTIPSLTVLFGPVELSTSTYLYGGRFFEQDTWLKWYQREDAKRKWSVYGALGHYGWPGGHSVNGQAGLRWRLR
jgi:hypothetical protein